MARVVTEPSTTEGPETAATVERLAGSGVTAALAETGLLPWRLASLAVLAVTAVVSFSSDTAVTVDSAAMALMELTA